MLLRYYTPIWGTPHKSVKRSISDLKCVILFYQSEVSDKRKSNRAVRMTLEVLNNQVGLEKPVTVTTICLKFVHLYNFYLLNEVTRGV